MTEQQANELISIIKEMSQELSAIKLEVKRQSEELESIKCSLAGRNMFSN